MTMRGKHVIITGGSSGIGLATAVLLAGEGASVSLLARDADRLRQAVAEAGPRATAFAVDVTDRDALRRAVDETRRLYGPCDVLVTCAGFAHPGHAQQLGDDIYLRTMDVDYFGTLWAVRAVLPDMLARRDGVIVGVSSILGFLGVYGYTAYSAAKFAVRGYFDVLRMELKDKGVHVACVYPADVRTPQLAYEDQFKPPETAALNGTVRAVDPEVVARAIRHGIISRRDEIYSDSSSPLLARFSHALPGLYRWMCHRRLKQYRRKVAVR